MSGSKYKSELGVVGGAIAELLGTVNEGFDWDVVTERYDEDPTGMAMGLFFTNEEGDEPVEQVYVGVSSGPEIVLIEELDASWEYIGSVVTYQDYGLRILDPDDEMDPKRARYQYGGVDIHPESGHSRERVWMVTSNVLDAMLESIIWKQKSGEKVGSRR